MFVMKHVVSGLVWWAVAVAALVGVTGALQQLAADEDNNILTAEELLRSTINTLFSLLRLRQTKNRPRLQQYSLVHNYFISLTLQDYNALREIAKLTKVDNDNTENITSTFIAVLNEILDEENVLAVVNVLTQLKKSYVIDDEISELEFLKHHYIDPIFTMNINKDILKLLEDDGPPDKTAKIIKDTPLLPPNNISDIDRDILRLIDDDKYFFDNVSYTTERSSTINNATNKDGTDDGFWREEDTLQIQRRIFNGQRTKIIHYPFMASVQIFNKFQCGSSIIKDDLVITAASCLQLAWNNRFYRENPQFLSVRIGSSFYESGGESVPILEVYFYPGYDPRKLTHNLAVMRLYRRIRWHKRVKKIPLDQLDSPLPLNTDGILVIGWGAQSASNIILNPFQNKIKYSILDIYPLDECATIYSKEYVTRKNFCAGFISVGGGACNRDLGGPGVVSGYLTGIISFGAPVCGRADSPTVFTKVGYYYDWIEEIMEQDVPNVKRATTLLTERPTSYTIKEDKFATLHWTETPIFKTKTTSDFTLSIEEKDKQKKDKVGFKEFLKTMFDSDEIEEYFDTIKEKHKQSAVRTKSPVEVSSQHGLRMSTPELSDDNTIRATQLAYDSTWSPPLVMNKSDDDDYDTTTVANLEMFEIVDEQSIDEDKELEKRILKLINEVKIMPPSGSKPAYPKDVSNGKLSEKAAKDKIDEAILALLYLSDNEKGSTAKPGKKKYTVDSLMENDDFVDEETTPTDTIKEHDITIENLKEERKKKKKRKSKKKTTVNRAGKSEMFVSRDGIAEAFKRDGTNKQQYNFNGTKLNDTEMMDSVDNNDTMYKDVGLDDFLSDNLLFEIFQDIIAEVNNTINTNPLATKYLNSV